MIVELAYESPPTNYYNLARQPKTWFTVSEQDVVGANALKLTCTKEEGNQVKRKLTGDIKFYNDFGTKDLILNYLITLGNSYMWIRIFDCNCNVYIFTGQITRDKLEWCEGDCFVNCRATEYDDVTDAYNSLNNVLDYDRYKAAGEHILNFMVRNGDTEAGAAHYQEAARAGGLLKNSINTLPQFVFKSSILNDQTGLNAWTGDYYSVDMGAELPHNFVDRNPYYYMNILNADISKGLKLVRTSDNIRPEHEYVRTIKDFLNELKQVFNADYLLRMNGGDVEFIFERKDYFSKTATLWKDCTAYNVCFELDDRNRYAYMDAKWQPEALISDAIDVAFEKTMYDNIVEWNRPVNPIQKEVYSVNLPYGFAPVYPSSTSLGDRSDGGLGMRPPYTFSVPTLVIPGVLPGTNIWEGLGRTIGLTLATVWDYNTPLYFTGDVAAAYYEYTGLPATGGAFGSYYNYYRGCNLYDCFHFIEDPRASAANFLGYRSSYSRKFLRFTVDIEVTCAEYLSFTSDSAIDITLFGSTVRASIEEIVFDWETMNMVTGTMKASIRGIV